MATAAKAKDVEKLDQEDVEVAALLTVTPTIIISNSSPNSVTVPVTKKQKYIIGPEFILPGADNDNHDDFEGQVHVFKTIHDLQQSHLSRQSTNSDEKKYKCCICGKSFNQNRNLKRHVMEIHTNEKEKSCSKCPWCHLKFSRNSTLKTHVKNQHPEKYDHSEEQNHTCSVCEKKFKDLDNLKAHMLYHTTTKQLLINKFLPKTKTTTIKSEAAEVDKQIQCSINFDLNRLKKT